MAFIVAKLSGEKKRGGFLRIDGGEEIELFDGTVLKVTAGTHRLDFSSQPSAVKAGKDLLDVFTDNAFSNTGNAKDYDMTQHFEPNSVMLLTIESDAFGRIAGAPDCQMAVASDERIREMEDAYQDYLKGNREEAEDAELEATKAHNKLMLISFLTFFTAVSPFICMWVGWIKGVKFANQYGHKPKHSGLQGFVSFLCLIGGIALIAYLCNMM